MNPRYPIYIISKGRWESRQTSKALEKMKVPYRIVVEPQEFDRYAEVIAREKILVLPFSNLGQGSIPARNWVWEHSISEGRADQSPQNESESRQRPDFKGQPSSSLWPCPPLGADQFPA
jgi:hypothetical protein